MKVTHGKQKIKVITLGCSKNIVDSEYLLRQIQAEGITIIPEEDTRLPDIAIINTCGFIGDAKKESVDTFLHYVNLKNQGKVEKVYIMGCLSQRYKKELIDEVPELDGVYGVNELGDILQEIHVDFKKELLGERLITTPGHYAYLKISEGCDRKCSFCAIPLIKGKYQSRERYHILNEARFLVSRGVKEIMLIAQDLTSYGKDLQGENLLTGLVEEMTTISGLEWIRLHYAYPAKFPLELLDLINKNPKICKYLDIPLQHISTPVLKRMRRGYTRAQTMELVTQVREKVPGIALRTTLLTGFPGESQEDHEELVNFVKEAKFERLGVFAYSEEEDTHAWKNYKNDVPENIKEQRVNSIMKVQQGISLDKNKEKIGTGLKVIIDQIHADHAIGRTEHDSPEVDNEVIVRELPVSLNPGDFVFVHIDGASEYELQGKVIGE
jgi:ribosomal protein S12 methylthiotransferase